MCVFGPITRKQHTKRGKGVEETEEKNPSLSRPRPKQNRNKNTKLRIFDTRKKPGGTTLAPGGNLNEPKRCDRGNIPEERRENTNRAWVDKQQENVHLSQCVCVWGVPVRPDLYLFKQGRERKKKHTHNIKFTEQLLRFGARLYTYKMRVDLCQLPGNRKDRRANKARTLPLPASLG